MPESKACRPRTLNVHLFSKNFRISRLMKHQGSSRNCTENDKARRSAQRRSLNVLQFSRNCRIFKLPKHMPAMQNLTKLIVPNGPLCQNGQAWSSNFRTRARTFYLQGRTNELPMVSENDATLQVLLPHGWLQLSRAECPRRQHQTLAERACGCSTPLSGSQPQG